MQDCVVAGGGGGGGGRAQQDLKIFNYFTELFIFDNLKKDNYIKNILAITIAVVIIITL